MGCILLPIFFLFVIGDALPCLGFNELCHLSLKTSTTLKTPLAFAMSWSSRVGLKNKTKVPSLVGYRTLPNCIIGENVERIDQFVSLGSFHSTHGGIELDVIRRTLNPPSLFCKKSWNVITYFNINMKLMPFRDNVLAGHHCYSTLSSFYTCVCSSSYYPRMAASVSP